MGIFLFLKQIVDMIYEIKALDVAMVLFAMVLIIMRIYSLFKTNNTFKQVFEVVKRNLHLSDFLVVFLGLLYLASFLRNREAINDFVKIESAFLIYFLGRMYGEILIKHAKKLALAGYIVIYSNLVYTIAHQVFYLVTGDYFPWEEFGIGNGGGIYYYKTDLAIGLVIAVIFIYLFCELKIFKWITIFLPTSYTIFTSQARMGQLILGILFAIIIIRELYKKTAENKENTKIRSDKGVKIISLTVLVLVSIFFVALHFSPVKNSDWYGTGVSQEVDDKIENIFHSRHVIFWDTFHYFINESPDKQIFGNDLSTLPLHNQRGMMSHCLYINMLYALGYSGLYVFLGLICLVFINNKNVENKDIRFLVRVLLMCFLIFGISMDTLCYTQISWFPFLFSGAVITLGNNKMRKQNEEDV